MKQVALAVALASGAAWAAPIVVQLSLANDGCAFDLTLNGVELTRGDTSNVYSAPVNPWTVAKGNELTVEVKPQPKSGACSVDLKVEEMDHATWGRKVLGTGKAGRALPTGALDAGVMTPKVTLRFDTSVDALSAWQQAAPFKDEKALRAYAVELVELARTGKWDLWVVESGPKFEQLAAAFQAPRAALMESERNAFGAWQQLKRGLSPGEIVLEPILDGRLWRLKQKKHPRALLVTKQGDEELALEIVVGVVDGRLRVVR